MCVCLQDAATDPARMVRQSKAQTLHLIKSKSYKFQSPKQYQIKDYGLRDFPGGPVVKTSPFNAGGAGLISSWGAMIPHASWPKKHLPTHKTEAIL